MQNKDKNPNLFRKLSDETLIQFLQENRDPKYLEALFLRYAHLVYGICLYYLQDKSNSYDLSVEIFEKLLAKLPSIKIENFRSWFYSFIRNCCLDHLRKQQSLAKNQRKWQIAQKSKDVFTENEGWRRLSKDINKEDLLEEALLKLNDKQRQCIELFYFQKKSYQEIALSSGEPVNQVKSHLQNGKRNLRIWLSTFTKKTL